MAFFGGADQSLQIVIKARDEASKVLDRMTGKMKKTAKDMKGVGVGMTAIGVGIGAMSYNFIKVASDAEETQSKFNVVFRGMEKEMNDWAESFGKDTGRARQDIKAWSSGMADVLKPMGLTTDLASEMSKKMVQLALDVASFNNKQDADVIHAFNSALTGERESLKTLGIVINETDVKQEAYAAGLAKAGEELSKEAKALATVNLLFKNSKDAQGDLIRTQDSFANKTKMVRSQLKDLSETMGNKLLPIVTPLIEKASIVITKFAEWAEKNKELTQKIIIGTAAFGALMLVLGPFLVVLPGLVTLFTILASPIGVIITLLGVLAVLVYRQIKGFDQFGKSIEVIANYLKKGLGKVLEYVSGKIKNLTKDIGILVKSLGAAVKDSKITKLGEKIGSSIEWGMGKAGLAVESTMNDIGNITNTTTNKIQEGMSSAGNFIVEKWQGVKSSTLGSIEDMLGGMGETTEKMMEDFKSSMGDLEIANENATKKLNESGKKIQDNFKKYLSTVKDFNTGVKNEIEATIGKIADLQQKLVDVEKDYNEKRKDNNMSYAQAYLDQENKIKDTKEEIANTSDIKDRNRLQTKLAEQISVLEQFSSLEKTYHTEIEFLRAEALKSELQRQVEKLKEKERHELAEYSRVKEKILKEITAETQKYEDLKALQEKGLEEYAKYLARSETMTADSIDREIAKYNALAEAVKNARQAQSSFSGYSFSVQNTVAGLGQRFNDFISRPGSAPVSFSPDDTIIGVKNPEKLGGGVTININNPTVRDDRDIDRIRDVIDDYFRTVMVNNKITA
ncbi:MAG: phage tail tape measure protein [Spirochaetes bacterium]|nr:phage tail tape measure protein [Spirochaetota bacterium]